MKRLYETPMACAEEFMPNEYVAACYKLSCKVGDNVRPPYGFKWAEVEYGGASH